MRGTWARVSSECRRSLRMRSWCSRLFHETAIPTEQFYIHQTSDVPSVPPPIFRLSAAATVLHSLPLLGHQRCCTPRWPPRATGRPPSRAASDIGTSIGTTCSRVSPLLVAHRVTLLVSLVAVGSWNWSSDDSYHHLLSDSQSSVCCPPLRVFLSHRSPVCTPESTCTL